jgi:hypothetical protein
LICKAAGERRSGPISDLLHRSKTALYRQWRGTMDPMGCVLKFNVGEASRA